MSNLNDLWVSYPTGEGYVGKSLNDLMKAALQDQASSSSKSINDLWKDFLTSQGYSGSLNQALYDYLGSLGYSGNLNDRLVQSLTAGDFFGSGDVSCSIALTGDIAAVFGGQPLDISGQTVSKTMPASPANFYGAGGPVVPVSWSGWRAFAYKASVFNTAGDSYHSVVLGESDLSAYVQLSWDDTGAGAWLGLVNGVFVVSFFGSATSKVGIRVDGSTGDVEMVVDSVVKTKADAPALGAALAGAEVFIIASIGTPLSSTLTEGDTYEAQVYTAAADLTDVGFPAGTKDWCGNEIPFSPLSIPGLVGYYDITASGALSQDTAGATPADAATDPIGRVDAVGIVTGKQTSVRSAAAV